MTDKPLPRREAWLLARRKKRRRVLLWQVGLLLALFGLWQLTTSTGLSDGFLVSSPSRMWGTFLSLCRSGELLRHIGTSCLETVVGFLAGTLLGTAVAICMWWSGKLARILDPYLVVLNALPKTALGPIFIVWMGAGQGAIIVMTLAISLIVTILNMYQGFLSTDGEKIRLMRSLGASRWQMVRTVVLPVASAGIFSALMIGLGRAVGETMIVLMATGNTPIMDWNIFNGMRTLSANIATELPEAAQDSTHSRVLFLGGLILFSMTFILNTLAEIVRQRLRKRFNVV